jgi:hypothetical protein
LFKLVDVCITTSEMLKTLSFVLYVDFVVALLDVGFDKSLDCVDMFVSLVHAQKYLALRTGSYHLHHFEIFDVECFDVA